VDVQLHEFLNSALDGGEWSASRPGRFTPRKSVPATTVTTTTTTTNNNNNNNNPATSNNNNNACCYF